MEKNKKYESGFSLVEVILVVLVVGLLGVVGYMVYKNHKKVPVTTTAQTQKTTSSATKTTTTTTSKQSTQQTQAYLDIKELGIKFPIPQSVSDLTYTWGTDSSNTATLHSQAWLHYIKTNDPTCAADDAKISSPPQDWAGYISEVTTGASSNTVTVNGKTYAFGGHQQGCNPEDQGNPSAVNQKEVANDQAIIAVLKQAVAD